MKLSTLTIMFAFAASLVGCAATDSKIINDKVISSEEGSEFFQVSAPDEKTFKGVCIIKCPDALSATIDKWNDFVGYDLIHEDGDISLIFYLVSKEELLDRLNSDDPDARGGSLFFPNQGVNPRCEVYILNADGDNEPLIAHEIGHCFGFGHSDNPLSIMYKHSGSYFTEGMRELMEERYGF